MATLLDINDSLADPLQHLTRVNIMLKRLHFPIRIEENYENIDFSLTVTGEGGRSHYQLRKDFEVSIDKLHDFLIEELEKLKVNGQLFIFKDFYALVNKKNLFLIDKDVQLQDKLALGSGIELDLPPLNDQTRKKLDTPN